MPQQSIEIHGARENNLKNVSLRIPKRKITIFTGVSGSGKSSIVFDTIATEAQRQLYESFSMFVRNFLPRYAQPEADSIKNLGMAIVVDQKRLGGGSQCTRAHSVTDPTIKAASIPGMGANAFVRANPAPPIPGMRSTSTARAWPRTRRRRVLAYPGPRRQQCFLRHEL
jgi:hypothetical protein